MKSRLPVLALALVLGFVAVGCGDDDDDNPTGPSNTDVKFVSTLLPGNEVPPIGSGNADSTASGTMLATLHTTKDAGGNITAATVDFTVNVAGFPTGTTITASHIHPGAAGVNGPALVSLGLTAGELALSATGAGTITKNAIVFQDLAQAQALVNNPATYYFNVHTTLNGGGAIRGQMVKQ